MRAKIIRAYQPNGCNVVEFTYNTGSKRCAYLGDRYYIFTATQQAFLDKATATEKSYGTIWEVTT